MTAKEMFEKKGFSQYAKSDKCICYTRNGGKVNDGNHRIKFKVKQKKITLHSDIDMETLNAIIEQCRELGWYEE
ncbi:MAG: hypothetical protein Q4A12_08330 [Eubacteriales bacterium]|nr:hypothetical protein [Eubacteriales bacterium]